MTMWSVWLILAVVLVLVEVLAGFVAAFCLAVGCLVAMIVDLAGGSLTVQMCSVAVGTALAFFIFGPMIRRWHERKAKGAHAATNMDALIGREVILPETLDAGRVGRLTLDGDNWQFRSHHGNAIEAGTKVKVVGYDSIVLTVETV